MGQEDGLAVGRLDDQSHAGFPGGKAITRFPGAGEHILLGVEEDLAAVDLLEFAPPGKPQLMAEALAVG
jgi:hypothetical protein